MADDPLRPPVWTYDSDRGVVHELDGRKLVEFGYGMLAHERDVIGPLLAAAPLLQPLVAALNNIMDYVGGCPLHGGDCARLGDCQARGEMENARALLAHPALTKLELPHE